MTSKIITVINIILAAGCVVGVLYLSRKEVKGACHLPLNWDSYYNFRPQPLLLTSSGCVIVCIGFTITTTLVSLLHQHCKNNKSCSAALFEPVIAHLTRYLAGGVLNLLLLYVVRSNYHKPSPALAYLCRNVTPHVPYNMCERVSEHCHAFYNPHACALVYTLGSALVPLHRLLPRELRNVVVVGLTLGCTLVCCQVIQSNHYDGADVACGGAVGLCTWYVVRHHTGTPRWVEEQAKEDSDTVVLEDISIL